MNWAIAQSVERSLRNREVQRSKLCGSTFFLSGRVKETCVKTYLKRVYSTRTWTWNLLIRSQAPYPFGHRVILVFKRRHSEVLILGPSGYEPDAITTSLLCRYRKRDLKETRRFERVSLGSVKKERAPLLMLTLCANTFAAERKRKNKIKKHSESLWSIGNRARVFCSTSRDTKQLYYRDFVWIGYDFLFMWWLLKEPLWCLSREFIRSWAKSLVVFGRQSPYRRPIFLEKCVAVSLDSDSIGE